MIKYIETKRLFFFVSENEDGTLNFTERNGKPVISEAVGTYIGSLGGLEKTKERIQTFDGTMEEFEAYREKLQAEWAARAKHDKELRDKANREREERIHAERKAKYDELIATYKDKPIPTTIHNLAIVAEYLNTFNWGVWELPKMAIAYAANQYDCDGKSAVTIKLDKPIEIFEDEDEEEAYKGETMFETGAPVGHLRKYQRI